MWWWFDKWWRWRMMCRGHTTTSWSMEWWLFWMGLGRKLCLHNGIATCALNRRRLTCTDARPCCSSCACTASSRTNRHMSSSCGWTLLRKSITIEIICGHWHWNSWLLMSSSGCCRCWGWALSRKWNGCWSSVLTHCPWETSTRTHARVRRWNGLMVMIYAMISMNRTIAIAVDVIPRRRTRDRWCWSMTINLWIWISWGAIPLVLFYRWLRRMLLRRWETIIAVCRACIACAIQRTSNRSLVAMKWSSARKWYGTWTNWRWFLKVFVIFKFYIDYSIYSSFRLNVNTSTMFCHWWKITEVRTDSKTKSIKFTGKIIKK